MAQITAIEGGRTMKCAQCGEIFNHQPINGICCSQQCSLDFGASLTPEARQPEPRDLWEIFFLFCLWQGVDLRQ